MFSQAIKNAGNSSGKSGRFKLKRNVYPEVSQQEDVTESQVSMETDQSEPTPLSDNDQNADQSPQEVSNCNSPITSQGPIRSTYKYRFTTMVRQTPKELATFRAQTKRVRNVFKTDRRRRGNSEERRNKAKMGVWILLLFTTCTLSTTEINITPVPNGVVLFGHHDLLREQGQAEVYVIIDQHI